MCTLLAADIDECSTGTHNCSHSCVNNTDGGFICACPDGLFLGQDNSICEGIYISLFIDRDCVSLQKLSSLFSLSDAN